jgi:hypothetical protein
MERSNGDIYEIVFAIYYLSSATNNILVYLYQYCLVFTECNRALCVNNSFIR